MQSHGEVGMQTGHAETKGASSARRKSAPRRKVTIRLSEPLFQRLEAATHRPGVGKSLVVEAALGDFLDPTPSVEQQDQFGELHHRFDRLEQDMRMLAETVALHARYQLAVMPPLPPAQQRESAILGDERFKVLAEQVERRVRQGRPLMRETIERLKTSNHGKPIPPANADPSGDSNPGDEGGNPAAQAGDLGNESSADVGELSSKPHSPNGATHSARRRGFTNEATQSGPAEPNLDPELTNEREDSRPLSKWRLIFSVFFPFAVGYFLSFLFRTISASISPAIASDFGLDAGETGLLASIYFLVFAGAQIPIGVLLDRYGPRRVQSVLLVIAVGGASLFGNADSFAELLIGRAMIGLGVAASLMAGLKAIVIWFPRDRIALVNGGMIMLGSLGAVTATAPTDWLLSLIGWRNLFEVLTLASLAAAGLVYFIVPESITGPEKSATPSKKLTLRSIFSDRRFLRIAPLSATCIGSSWAMHSLWAAAWLADVERLGPQDVISQLFLMAVGISLGALLLGIFADRLRKRGIPTEALFAIVAVVFILAEFVILLQVPLPSIVPWSIISVVGAATVLSYALVAEYFPVGIAARANGALNLLHFGCAFAFQYGVGLIVGHWAAQDGHYPVVAFQTAFGTILILQMAALLWFSIPWLLAFIKNFVHRIASPSSELSGEKLVAAFAEGSIIDADHGADW